MKRDFGKLADQEFDVLLVGAGIFGACIARELALRDVTVAIVDRADFGAATSANSLKIIHGGLRYLQKLDVRRMRASARERRAWLRTAPHLITPMRCVIPTHGRGARSRFAMRAALSLCDWITGENRTGARKRAISPGGVLSRAEMLDLFPGLRTLPGLTGGAYWYDGQVQSTERLTLACVRSAVERGAVAVNYVQADALLHDARRIIGVVVQDRIAGQTAEVRARLVVDACGPWAGRLLADSGLIPSPCPEVASLAKAWNLVCRPMNLPHALGVPTPPIEGRPGSGGRMLFLTPWHGQTILGTMYTEAARSDHPRLSDAEARRLLDDVNRAYPAAELSRQDVRFHHVGLQPIQKRPGADAADCLMDRDIVLDHERQHGLRGLLTVSGVKYTTSRITAEAVADLVCRRLDRHGPWPSGAEVPVDGGDMEAPGNLVAELRKRAPDALASRLPQIVCHYGTRAAELVDHCREHPEDVEPVDPRTDVTRVEVRYAVREEMGMKLADVIMRRTDLSAAGLPDTDIIRKCANIMAEDLDGLSIQFDEEVQDMARALTAGVE
ncbi:MAG: glycerol-3-phosphate dehydrogenase/oxidase [Phycisphaerae bacterium]|nr:glycerol-3-phosphate dehydrogenase/oxidase [Phycisphaerae bacterium]